MDLIHSARKLTEDIVEKTVTGVSDAIYATGSAIEKGGSKITDLLTTSAGAVGDLGSGIYGQACSLVGATGTASNVQRALEKNENFEDIMAEEEAEDQKVRQSARVALDKVSGDDKKMVGVTSRKDLDCVSMLPLSKSPDAWKTAEPVTKTLESPYPFEQNGKRPTATELDVVYKSALGIVLNPVNKEYREELELYIKQMFGKSQEVHNAMKSSVSVDKIPTKFKVKLKLIDGKNMIARDANGKSDPYCFISIIKAVHLEMLLAAKQSMEKVSHTKGLGLDIKKSQVIPRSLNPTWNESYELELHDKNDILVIEVWDSDDIPVTFKEVGFSGFGKFLRDIGDSDDFMGRAHMPVSAISLTDKEKELILFSRNKKKQFGSVRVRVSLVGEKPAVDSAVAVEEHTQLVATVLDFESHVTGKYIKGWDTKITPLGDKLITLNATMNGLPQLQQAAVLFPLLQLYDKHINLSIIGYFGVVRAISVCQDQLPSGPSGSREAMAEHEKSQPAMVRSVLMCLGSLDDTLIGVLRRHHQFFNFKAEEGIEYLALHVELIKEIYTIVPFIERLEDMRKSLQQTMQDACMVATVGWIERLVAEAIPASPGEKERLLCYLEVIECIKQRLHNTVSGVVTVQSIFDEVGVDYYTLLFTIVDKQISAEIEDYLTNHIKRGHVSSYQLYLHLGDMLKLATNIPSKKRAELHLNEYHEWFTDLVADWIDFAADKCNVEIKRAITGLDQVVTVTENVKFSQSALSAAACFKRIAAFWNNLHWPQVVKQYGFMMRVVENISKAARFYVKESHDNLKRKGFHHDSASEEFVVTQQLCISLNDMEYVREELSKIPDTLQFDPMISRLGAVEGDQQAIAARRNLLNLVNSANDDVKFLINQVVSSIGEQIATDISHHIKRLINSDPKADLIQLMDPLMAYLSRNMGTFHSSSLVAVLEIMIEEIWNVIVNCYAQAIKTRLGQKAAKRVLTSIMELESFFYAGGDGLSKEQIKSDEFRTTCEILEAQSSTDDELISHHLKTLAKWTKTGNKSDSMLHFSVGYIQNKEILEITVVKGTNLPAVDSNGFSDPFVEIVLMPEKRFKIKAVKTDYKGKELNPVYHKDFKINVKEKFLDMSGSVVSLTVFDHDFITKNEFCGMVVIACKDIPRLPTGSSGIDDPNAPERKNLSLPLVTDTMTPALKELSERSHQYVHDFNLWYKRGSSFAGNIASSLTGGFARAFSLRH